MLLMVLMVLMSLFIVVYEDHESQNMKDWSDVVDTAIKHTMPPTTMLMNAGLFVFGRFGRDDQLPLASWTALAGQALLMSSYAIYLKRAGAYRAKKPVQTAMVVPNGHAPMTQLLRSGKQLLRGSLKDKTAGIVQSQDDDRTDVAVRGASKQTWAEEPLPLRTAPLASPGSALDTSEMLPGDFDDREAVDSTCNVLLPPIGDVQNIRNFCDSTHEAFYIAPGG